MEAKDIEHRFTFHIPSDLKIKQYMEIRQHTKDLAIRLNEICPEGREKSLAMTKLEEVVFWANKSIARGEE